MSAKFTLGPWSIRPHLSQNPITECKTFTAHSVHFWAGETLLGEVTAYLAKEGFKEGYPRIADFNENKANAYLIAAAPELYVELASKAHEWEVRCQIQGIDPTSSGEHVRLTALLKKARGEA